MKDRKPDLDDSQRDLALDNLVPKAPVSASPNLLTVRQWATEYKWPSEAALRNYVFHAKQNGFDAVVRRVGRRVLIDETAFFAWVEAQNGGGHVDLACASRFLELLDDAGGFTFQTFLDSDRFRDSDVGIRSAAECPRVLHGSLDQHARQLTALNEQGAGIFVMVNAGDGVVHAGANSCRATPSVIQVRALFLDLDGAPLAPVLISALAPDWVVQSSPGRWHAYWKVEDCPLDAFSAAQTALAGKYEGDSSVKDLPRVMRVPGFVHRKADPFTSELWLPSHYPALLGNNND